MARQRILLNNRHAKLSEPFGYDYAVRLFGQEAVDSLPKLERGPNKGTPKGCLHWRTAMTAGWVSECQAPCKAGGLVDAWIGEHMGSLRDDAMRGLWCGREQSLAGSRSVLTEAYRAQETAARLEQQAEYERLKASWLELQQETKQ